MSSGGQQLPSRSAAQSPNTPNQAYVCHVTTYALTAEPDCRSASVSSTAKTNSQTRSNTQAYVRRCWHMRAVSHQYRLFNPHRKTPSHLPAATSGGSGTHAKLIGSRSISKGQVSSGSTRSYTGIIVHIYVHTRGSHSRMANPKFSPTYCCISRHFPPSATGAEGIKKELSFWGLGFARSSAQDRKRDYGWSDLEFRPPTAGYGPKLQVGHRRFVVLRSEGGPAAAAVLFLIIMMILFYVIGHLTIICVPRRSECLQMLTTYIAYTEETRCSMETGRYYVGESRAEQCSRLWWLHRLPRASEQSL